MVITDEQRLRVAVGLYRRAHVHRRTMRIFRQTQCGPQVLVFVLSPGECSGNRELWPNWLLLGTDTEFNETREYGLKRYNYAEPRRHVAHRDLERAYESAYKSICPECHDGVLFVQRDQTELTLMRSDMCTHCWCRFWYLDDTINGEKLHDG